MSDQQQKLVFTSFNLATAGTNRMFVWKVEKKGNAVSIELVSTGGGAPTGSFTFFGSNTVSEIDGTGGNEISVTPSTAPTNPAGADVTTGAVFLNFPFQYLIGKYTRTSGTGTLAMAGYARAS